MSGSAWGRIYLGRNSSDHVFTGRAIDDVAVAVLAQIKRPSQPVGVELRGARRIFSIQIGPAKRTNPAKDRHTAMLAWLEDADDGSCRVLNDGKASYIWNVGRWHDLLSSKLDRFCSRRIDALDLHVKHPVRRNVRINLILHEPIRTADVTPTNTENRVGHVRTHWQILCRPSKQVRIELLCGTVIRSAQLQPNERSDFRFHIASIFVVNSMRFVFR